ncbi:MAG: glycosyltransferase family 2 protein [Verrucomicrobiae bacterium]
MPRLSVIIPFFNESETVRGVLEEVRDVLPDAEIVAVDDGSSDGTRAGIESVSGVRTVVLSRNCGQSAALYAGLREATGDLLAMMDGDGQNDPADLPRMIGALARGDVVYGVRVRRQDTLMRRFASRFANALRRAVLGDRARDTGCTMKVIRRAHRDLLVPFNGLHRFLPAFFERAGLTAVEVEVNHRPRRAGTSKYTIGGRALRGAWDLIGVRWLLSRRILWPETIKK